MTRGSIAALAAGTACLLAAAGAAGSADSTIARQDSDAKSNARNAVSLVESCFAEFMDYRKCRSASVLNQGMGEYAVPIGRRRGQVRVTRQRDAGPQVHHHRARRLLPQRPLVAQIAGPRLLGQLTI